MHIQAQLSSAIYMLSFLWPNLQISQIFFRKSLSNTNNAVNMCIFYLLFIVAPKYWFQLTCFNQCSLKCYQIKEVRGKDV